MGTRTLILCLATLFSVASARAATLYVDAASTNAIPPFANWANAAANIQDAVDAAAPGDEIVVTNGVYQTGARAVYGMSNRVAVTKLVTVRSVNGPEVTRIAGSGSFGLTAVRCVYLTNGAVLSGFTLTNGVTQISGNIYMNQSGGGVWCEGTNTIITNCVIAGNAANVGGGVFGGTLNNCALVRNFAWDDDGGGGAYGSTLNNCLVTGNRSYYDGGGASASTLNECTVTGNSSWYESGGGAWNSTLNNCTLSGNDASEGGGASASTLNKCLVVGNAATGDYSIGGGVAFSLVNNCTLTGNSAGTGGGAWHSTLRNCIVYYNSDVFGYANHGGCTFNNSCTTPAPESGIGNITNAPLFVDTNGWSNLRLQSNSPCINAGNNAYVTAATDLDGLPRIAGGTADMGAYEFQSPASTISYAWLQQSGLPTDGSADYVDTDHDRHNNWQEWVAGTDPTNALSVLWLTSPVITPTNVILTWTSVTNRAYTLEQSTNLGGALAFSVLRSNLAGLPAPRVGRIPMGLFRVRVSTDCGCRREPRGVIFRDSETNRVPLHRESCCLNQKRRGAKHNRVTHATRRRDMAEEEIIARNLPGRTRASNETP